MKTKNTKSHYITDYDKNIMCYYCQVEYNEGFSVGFRISVNKKNYILNDETIVELIKKSISRHLIPDIKNIKYSFVGRFKDGKYYD